MREGKPTRWVSLISTHVSVRRRTAIQHLFPAPENISIHVSLRRRTMVSFLAYSPMIFQFTSPYGDEPYLGAWSSGSSDFNSRLLTETNRVQHQKKLAFIISIHVSLRRRTFQCILWCSRDLISIHVSLRRRTTYPEEAILEEDISIHVSLRRRTAKRINMLDLYFLIEQLQQ